MERKFTDQQVALILKRAAERQVESGDAAHSLESIQDIAREVGIDPRVVAEVAATLDASHTESTLFGASSAYRSSRRLALNASTIDHAAVLATIREHLPLAGEKRDVGDGIEWHSGPADNKTVVAITPSAGGATLRIDVRQHGPKAMAYIGAGIVGMVAGVASVAALHGPGVAVGVAAFWSSFAGARAIWNRHARTRDQRMGGLSDALAAQLASGGSDP
jgi:hypothetical protein